VVKIILLLLNLNSENHKADDAIKEYNARILDIDHKKSELKSMAESDQKNMM
jgi:hypothetical protein